MRFQELQSIHAVSSGSACAISCWGGNKPRGALLLRTLPWQRALLRPRSESRAFPACWPPGRRLWWEPGRERSSLPSSSPAQLSIDGLGRKCGESQPNW